MGSGTAMPTTTGVSSSSTISAGPASTSSSKAAAAPVKVLSGGGFAVLGGVALALLFSHSIPAANSLSYSSMISFYIDLISVTMTFSSSIFSACICMPFCTGGLINFARSTGGKNHLEQS